jgi:predicted MFS family arabinose efflux permease
MDPACLLGPPIAGFLADHLSWRWVFLGVLPLIVVATALILPHLRGIDGASCRAQARQRPLAAAAGSSPRSVRRWARGCCSTPATC